MTRPLDELTPEELRQMVLNLEAQLCDLYARLDEATTEPPARP